MIEYPGFDPVALRLGPLAIRWYGLMYLVGFVAAWWLAQRRSRRPGSLFSPEQVQDLIFYCCLGVLAGGRIGYLLFYGWQYVLEDPLYIVRIWEGGMSFHGGLVGVCLGVLLYVRKHGSTFAQVADFVVPLAPAGLFAGRIGNFINNELWGKPAEVPWAFVVDGVARHPTQLYEALPGRAWCCSLRSGGSRRGPRRSPGGAGAGAQPDCFLPATACSAFMVEFLRLPDEHIGYLALDWLTMGHLLSLPMLLIGLWLLARRAPQPA